jgi:hypothetical protein
MLHKEEILFSKEECDKIISYMEMGIDDIIPVDFAGKYNEVGGKMVSYNSILENEKRWFIDKIITWLNNIPSIKKIKNNNICTVYRNYKTGDYFVKHSDHIKNGPLRIYTVGIHLNSQEDFTGGEFKIYENNNEKLIKFETGKVYIFESSTPHSVDMITSGNRITLMLFIEKQNLKNNLFL